MNNRIIHITICYNYSFLPGTSLSSFWGLKDRILGRCNNDLEIAFVQADRLFWAFIVAK